MVESGFSMKHNMSPPDRNTLEDEIARLPGMSRRERIRRKAQLEAEIAAEAFELRYVEFCEDARTPGILGYYAGVTLREERIVKVSTMKTYPIGGGFVDTVDRDIREIIAILQHELRHVREPEWDCGNRKVL
jgi:hypothetical protein